MTSCELIRSSTIHKLVGSLLLVGVEGLHTFEVFDLALIKLVAKTVGINEGVRSSFGFSAFFDPLWKATVKHLDVLMTHSLEHPCNSVAEELHGT